jgi:hypothetical protein
MEQSASKGSRSWPHVCTVAGVPLSILARHSPATEPRSHQTQLLGRAPDREASLSVLLRRIVVLTQLPGKVTQPDALDWMRNAVLL